MKTSIQLNSLETIIEIPMIPSFIKTIIFGIEIPVPIENICEKNLAEIGEIWTKALITNANERKKI